MNPNESRARRVHPDVLRQFERTKGVPPQIIAEMFARIEAPEEVRQAFWNALRAKKTNLDHGFIGNITVERDGTVGIWVDDGGLGHWFYAPDEMTEEQFDVLKDAFARGLAVDVFWQVDANGDVVIVFVTVYGSPPK